MFEIDPSQKSKFSVHERLLPDTSFLHLESATLSELMNKSKNEKITSLGFFQRVPPSLPPQIREHIKHLKLAYVEDETYQTNALSL